MILISNYIIIFKEIYYKNYDKTGFTCVFSLSISEAGKMIAYTRLQRNKVNQMLKNSTKTNVLKKFDSKT